MSFRFRLMALAVVLLLAFTDGYSSAQNPTLKTAMREKLADARPLLEAVVTADYTAIGRSANALNRISETEIATWQVGAGPELQEQAIAFVLAVQGLRDAAAKRDLDSALADTRRLSRAVPVATRTSGTRV